MCNGDDLDRLLAQNNIPGALNLIEERGYKDIALLRRRWEETVEKRASGQDVRELEGALAIDIRIAYRGLRRETLDPAPRRATGGKRSPAPRQVERHGGTRDGVFTARKTALQLMQKDHVLRLRDFEVVDGYVRYRPPHKPWKMLLDFTHDLLHSCTVPSAALENYLVYSPSGNGKTHLFKRFWKEHGTGDRIHLVVIDLKEKGLTGRSLGKKLDACKGRTCPVLCVVDEVDKANPSTLYTVLHDAVELNQTQGKACPNVVFVAIGSAGGSVAGLRTALIETGRGNDLQTRLPKEFEIPLAASGDRMVIAAQRASEEGITEIEKSALLFFMLNSHFHEVRGMVQWMEGPLAHVNTRCAGSSRKDLRYDDLYARGSMQDKDMVEAFRRDYASEMRVLDDFYMVIED